MARQCVYFLGRNGLIHIKVFRHDIFIYISLLIPILIHFLVCYHKILLYITIHDNLILQYTNQMIGNPDLLNLLLLDFLLQMKGANGL